MMMKEGEEEEDGAYSIEEASGETESGLNLI